MYLHSHYGNNYTCIYMYMRELSCHLQEKELHGTHVHGHSLESNQLIRYIGKCLKLPCNDCIT